MPLINLSLNDIPLDTPVPVEDSGSAVVVIRSAEGVRAYKDLCPHAFWPLSAGAVNNGVLECPGHGWEFNVETGKCLSAPAYCLTPVSAAVDGETVSLSWEMEFAAVSTSGD